MKPVTAFAPGPVENAIGNAVFGHILSNFVQIEPYFK